MFIKYLDYLSPRVTFYHKGFLSHSSILSGIISIIAAIFIIIFGIIFLLEIIIRKNPNVSFFRSFEKDAGVFQVNTSSLFHFINIGQIYRGITTFEEFDFTSFNIVGAQCYSENYIGSVKKTGIKSFDHWLYGYCNKDINTEGLDDLITYDFFNKSACIKKYYNSTEGQYYDIGDPKFSWPFIAHGTFSENNILYGLFIQKCNNELIKEILGDDYQCRNSSEFNSYLNSKRGSKIFHFNFINYYINSLDYYNPINKYFYRIENPLSENQYTTNSLNLNPALVNTNDGLIFDSIKENKSYIYERNDAYVFEDEGNNNLYMNYCFFLKNIVEYYKRSYKKLQDIISSIGGINQAITFIAIIMNSLYNNFVILSDTETLLHFSIHIEKKNYKKKSIELKNIKNKLKEVKEKKDKEDKNDHKKQSKRKKYNTDTPEIKFNNIDNSKNICLTNSDKKDAQFNLDSNMNTMVNNNNITNITTNITNIPTLKNRKEEKKSFWHYLCFILTCEKKMDYFKVYKKFRMKMISEEHLIRNHLNIYNLLKATEKKRYRRRSSYHLKDLFQLV